MTQAFRFAAGGAIHRNEEIRFSFDGRSYTGYRGDTLASALLANGVRLFGRSFKYHRPRGILTCGSEEPNALVELRAGARREPNTRATTVELYDGLEAHSQNRWPSLRFDILSANSLFSPLFVAGFYYKTFMWPASFWEPVYERIIRRAAGLGRAPREPDPDEYETCHRHCDVLVVGAGPAGLMAARKAAESGARVILCDENPWLGGRLVHERSTDQAWLSRIEQELLRFPNLSVLRRTTVFGAYDHGVFGALERVADHLAQPLPGQARHRLWTIRTQRAVIATGAHERPLVFPGNDLPGVMLASAVRAYATRFGVAAGRCIAVVTNNDDAYRTALDLSAAGVKVAAVIDTRAQPGAIAEQARAAGIEVRTAVLPKKAKGWQSVQALELMTPDGRAAGSIACDCIAMSGGYSPVVHLFSQSGKKPIWSDQASAFIPGAMEKNLRVVGAARGVFTAEGCVNDGTRAGSADASAPADSIGYGAETPPQPLWRVHEQGKSFVDFQNDVTIHDIRLASAEGYQSPEHLKRYTTLGMATDQGKTSNVNALGILAEIQGKTLSAMGTVTYRPPYLPVAIGSFAGHRRARQFQPIRRSPMHSWHENHDALFMEAGLWLRPSCFPRQGETPLQAIDREVLAVRGAAGLCDVSTLGKIEVCGPDAAEFLNRLYINSWTNLAVGKARYGLMLREDGFVFDDGTTSRLADQHFFMTTTTANAAAVLAHMEYYHQCVWPELDVVFCSATDQWAAMALAGPKAREILQRVVDIDVSNAALPFMGVAEARIDNIAARIFRISFSGEMAYEINVPWGYGQAVWERFIAAGAEFGLQPYGVDALNVLRIEKGHVTGAELDGRTAAAHLGLGRMMSDKKPYIGHTLAQRSGLTDENNLALVGVKARDGKSSLRAGANVITNSGASAQMLGHITSAAYSAPLKEYIGLALIAGGKNKIGQQLIADFAMDNKQVVIDIVDPCFIDPEGKRLHG